MEVPEKAYDAAQYRRTATGNIVHVGAVLLGDSRISITGKTLVDEGCELRGNVGTIRVGRYCFLGARATLEPPETAGDGDSERIPMSIGDHTTIGRDCEVRAAWVGASVVVEDGCTIGSRCILKDCCHVKAGSVVVDDMVVPPFSVVAGAPARIVDDVADSAAVLVPEEAMVRYQRLTPAAGRAD